MNVTFLDEPKSASFLDELKSASFHSDGLDIHDDGDGGDIIISDITSSQKKTIADAKQLQNAIQQRIDDVLRKVTLSKERSSKSSPNIIESQLRLIEMMLNEIEKCAEWKLGVVKLMNDTLERQQQMNKLAEMFIGSVHTDGWLSLQASRAGIEMMRKTLEGAVTQETIAIGENLRDSAEAELETIRKEIRSVHTSIEMLASPIDLEKSAIDLEESEDFEVTDNSEEILITSIEEIEATNSNIGWCPMSAWNYLMLFLLIIVVVAAALRYDVPYVSDLLHYDFVENAGSRDELQETQSTTGMWINRFISFFTGFCGAVTTTIALEFITRRRRERDGLGDYEIEIL